MNFLKKCSLGLLIAIPILMPIYSASTKQKKLETLTMGISLAGREPLIVPLPADRRKTAVLRVSGDNISGVKVVAWMEDGLAKFEVSTILDSLQDVTSCDQLQRLRTEPVGSYNARKGDTIPISGLKKNGLTSLHVTFWETKEIPLVCPDTCCCCGGTRCCPSPGHCLGCGSCGVCCN